MVKYDGQCDGEEFYSVAVSANTGVDLFRLRS